MANPYGKNFRKLAQRKLDARKTDSNPTWFGLSMFGVIGWSVAIPMVLFTFLGIWIDAHHPNHFSWTLMLLFLGVMIGCFNAWYWVNKESNS